MKIKKIRRIQYWENGEKKYRILPPPRIVPMERLERVRGYRIDKPDVQDSYFVPKYTQAVKILLMGARGIGKIEAVR